MIYDSKYDLKLSQLCKICSDYCRKGDERRKRGGFKDEWYQNGHLIKTKTDHVSTPTKIVCSVYGDLQRSPTKY